MPRHASTRLDTASTHSLDTSTPTEHGVTSTLPSTRPRHPRHLDSQGSVCNTNIMHEPPRNHPNLKQHSAAFYHAGPTLESARALRRALVTGSNVTYARLTSCLHETDRKLDGIMHTGTAIFGFRGRGSPERSLQIAMAHPLRLHNPYLVQQETLISSRQDSVEC